MPLSSDPEVRPAQLRLRARQSIACETNARRQFKGHFPTQLFDLLAKEPAIEAVFRQLADTARATLPERILEMIAIRVAIVLDSPYVLSGHLLSACPEILTRDEVVTIATCPRRFTGIEGAVLRAVDELLRSARLGRASRRALGDRMLAVKLAVGTYWLATAITQDLDPEPGVPTITGLESPARARRARLTQAA